MTWLSVKEAAELLGYVERTVRKKATNKEYSFRYVSSSKGRGGKCMEILLESLPEQAQKSYHNQIGEYEMVSNSTFFTKKQKEKAEIKNHVVSEYNKFRKKALKAGMKSKTEIMDMFVNQWNYEHDFKISRKSVYAWRKASKSGNPEKLIDKRGGYNRGKSSIPKKYQELFASLYLQQSKPTIKTCYNQVMMEANINGETIPGIKAFRLFTNNMDYAMKVRAREGQKAFDDKCMPYIERDYKQLLPNDYWVSDHHLWDIFVRIPDNKGGWKLARPWGTYWMDMRSRKVMSSIIRIESPDSDIVLCSFGLGAEHFGIPKGVRLDNGKDYKARDMFYPEGHPISEKDTQKIYSSLASNLQIEVTYAIPYNAKAKPIERMFNTFENQLGKQYPSYAGSNAKNRPEDLKNLNINDVITLEEFIKQHNLFVYEIYNETGHNGDSMFGKSPNQVYHDIPFKLRQMSKKELMFTLMRVKGTRKVGRNGITFNNTHFYNENCINHLNEKIIAKYDPTNPEILYIFDMNENFLFTVEEVQKIGWNLTKEDYQRENHRKKVAKQKALNSYTVDNVIRDTKTIGERLKTMSQNIDHADVATPKTIEIIRNPKTEENLKRISMSDLDRNYEDYLKRDKERKDNESKESKILADKFKAKMLQRAYAKEC